MLVYASTALTPFSAEDLRGLLLRAPDLVGDPTRIVGVVSDFRDGRWRSIAV